MYPNLSYILEALIGTQPDNWTSVINTFGLMLVVSILASAYFFQLELKRKEKEGILQPVTEDIVIGKSAPIIDLLFNGFIGFFVGFKFVYILLNFQEFKADPEAVIVSGKGVLLAGIVLGLANAGVRFWEKHKVRLDEPITRTVQTAPHEKLWTITIVGVMAGILGAKIFAVIEYMDEFLKNPIETFFSGSGMAIYGGLLFGFGAGIIYLKKIKMPVLPVLDAVAPALIFGSLFGRWGCHLSGDGCWGVPNTAPTPSWWIFPDSWWSYTYPHNVVRDGVPIEDYVYQYNNQLPEGVWPSSVYEMIMFAIIFIVLWALRKRIKIAGVLFFIYLIFNGIERFVIEGIRVNDRYDVLGFALTQAEIIAIGLMLVGLIGALILYMGGRRNYSE